MTAGHRLAVAPLLLRLFVCPPGRGPANARPRKNEDCPELIGHVPAAGEAGTATGAAVGAGCCGPDTVASGGTQPRPGSGAVSGSRRRRDAGDEAAVTHFA